MKTFTCKGIKICYYSDPQEYAKKFVEIPEGAEIAMEYLPKSTGMAEIDTKTIHIFKGSCCDFDELLSTVAHELGHIVEGGYKKNPPQKPRYDNKHEDKANHYEQFVMLARSITKNIFIKFVKEK